MTPGKRVSSASTRGSWRAAVHGRRESRHPALPCFSAVCCAVAFLLPVPAEAQERIEIEASLHTWDGEEVPRLLHVFRSASEVEQAVACVLKEAGGLRSDNFAVQAADVPNAVAAVWPAGCGNTAQPCERMLLYNPRFMRDIRNRTGNGWSGVAVLAHEIGHHLEAHTISARGSNPADELQADEFAGWVLRRLGAAMDDALAAFRISPPTGNSTHPPRDARLTAVAAGWDRSGRTGDTSCYTPPEADLPPDPAALKKPAPDRLVVDDDLRAEVTNVFYFRTEASAVGASVQSLGDVDVRAWIHAGLCGDVIRNPSNEDIFEDASARAEGVPRISFGRIRNTALDHVRYSDDDGPGTNFRFDLGPGECYNLLVDRHDPTVGGGYTVELVGTREVYHDSWSPDASWGDGHWHDLPLSLARPPATLPTGEGADSMSAYTDSIWAYYSPPVVTIPREHLRAEFTNVFLFQTEPSATRASVRSRGDIGVRAWIHLQDTGDCGRISVFMLDSDFYQDAANSADGVPHISLGHIRNTNLDHVYYSDDGGEGVNFRFDLEPGGCYQMVVEGYDHTVGGGYAVEWTGTTGVSHVSWPIGADRGFHRHGDRVVALPKGIVTGGSAYLVQAVQSMRASVPLMAGRDALLRVFPIAGRPTTYGIPAARARFYRDGREIHVVDVPGEPTPIPTEVDEGSLAKSLNARIPGHVVQPGLEVVIEIDEAGGARIPERGRLAFDVREMPPLEVTLIPMLWTGSNDRSVIDLTREMAARPESHPMLEDVRTLLPVGRLSVTALSHVWVKSNRTSDLLKYMKHVRTARGGTGHYMGLMSNFHRWAGRANRPGWSSVSKPVPKTIAHELGHNLNLRHAPCGDPADFDPAFPQRDGTIGAWGYDPAGGWPRLVSPRTPDLMSYCDRGNRWISPYNFNRALRYRLERGGHRFAAEAPPVVTQRTKSLLLWGGTDAQGTPYLDPAFVMDAPPKLPLAEGDHRLTGRTTAGDELFSLSFGMPEVADGDGGSVFVFALPVRPEWEEGLASLTLSGPGGSTTIDEDSDLPMTILRDPGSGQIRAFLQGDRRGDALGQAFAPDPGFALDPNLEVLFSQGIPDGAEWRR